jgi:hypothetical protein
MNNINRTIRTFNRFELKYVVSLKQAELFKATLKLFLVPDMYGNNQGRYSISNLYYDSPDLRCYYEKEAGLLNRRKLRIRCYETGTVLTDDASVFVEIKQRIDRITLKRRVVLPYRDALRLCNDRQMPDYQDCDKSTIEEIFAFLYQYNLQPVCIVRYNRQAFVGGDYDPGLRVTFDTALSCQTHQLHIHEPTSGLMILSPGQVVMEIKVNERIPSWLTSLIAAHNLQMVRVSKYCRSIEASQNQPGGLRRSPLAEYSHNVLSTSFSLYMPVERKMEIEK